MIFSSADGNFEVTLATKATLFHNGLVEVRYKYVQNIKREKCRNQNNQNDQNNPKIKRISGSLLRSTTPQNNQNYQTYQNNTNKSKSK